MKLTNPVRFACIVGGALISFMISTEVGWAFLAGAMVASFSVEFR